MRVLPLLALLIACGSKQPDPVTGPPPTQTEPPPDSGLPAGDSPQKVTLAADTPRTTEAGVRYTAPGGWTIIASGQIAVLEPPEADSTIAIVDALGAKDADDAVAIAWKLHQSGFNRKLRGATDRPATGGWTKVRAYEYEVPAAEHRLVGAVARQHGTSWHVALYDVAESTVDKRGARMKQLDDSILPPAP